MNIRKAVESDVDACVDILQSYRVRLKEFEPRFWNPAPNAAQMSRMWFAHLFQQSNVVALVAEEESVLVGFIIGTDYPAPPVFDPGGRNALIDDFAVSDNRWSDVGQTLLDAARDALRAMGYAQVVLVSPMKDGRKQGWLEGTDLSLASTWWTAET